MAIADRQGGIVRQGGEGVALDDQVHDPYPFQFVTADHWKHGYRLGAVADHAIGSQRVVQCQRGPITTDDTRHGDVETVDPLAPDGDPAPDVETFRIGDRDLFLAKVAVDGQWRFDGIRLAKPR